MENKSQEDEETKIEQDMGDPETEQIEVAQETINNSANHRQQVRDYCKMKIQQQEQEREQQKGRKKWLLFGSMYEMDMYVILIKSHHPSIEINDIERDLVEQSQVYNNLELGKYYLRMLYPDDNSCEIDINHNKVTIKEIEEQEKGVYTMDDEKIHIYVDKIKCDCKVMDEDDITADAYLSYQGRPTGEEDHEWKRGGEWLWEKTKNYEGGEDDVQYIWDVLATNKSMPYPGMINKQIYYDAFYKIIYCIDTKIAVECKTFDNSELKRTANQSSGYRIGAMRENKIDDAYSYQNITDQLWISDRYHWIKYKVLYGQDNEFNIFRTFCFCEAWQFFIRLAIGIICLILQILLTVGIVYEVNNNWDIDEMFDNDAMIITISFVVFSFMSYTTLWTVVKFFEFYENLSRVIKIASFIIILDFISNILIGITICCVSFFYLLQSETITDVVLNSFALTFIIELDDMANLFESDEDALMEIDWKNLSDRYKSDYNDETKRREVDIPYKYAFIPMSICLAIVSPFFIVICIFIAFGYAIGLIRERKKANQKDEYYRTLYVNKNKM